jgi:hypothetical protein
MKIGFIGRLLGRHKQAAILFASLIILLVGAGILYVWLGSGEAPAAVIAEPKAKSQLKEKEINNHFNDIVAPTLVKLVQERTKKFTVPNKTEGKK